MYHFYLGNGRWPNEYRKEPSIFHLSLCTLTSCAGRLEEDICRVKIRDARGKKKRVTNDRKEERISRSLKIETRDKKIRGNP